MGEKGGAIESGNQRKDCLRSKKWMKEESYERIKNQSEANDGWE